MLKIRVKPTPIVKNHLTTTGLFIQIITFVMNTVKTTVNGNKLYRVSFEYIRVTYLQLIRTVLPFYYSVVYGISRLKYYKLCSWILM